LRGIVKIILDTDWAERYNRRDKGKVWSQGMQREKVDRQYGTTGSVVVKSLYATMAYATSGMVPHMIADY